MGVEEEKDGVLAACAQGETPSARALGCGEEKKRKSMPGECAQGKTTLPPAYERGGRVRVLAAAHRVSILFIGH